MRLKRQPEKKITEGTVASVGNEDDSTAPVLCRSRFPFPGQLFNQRLSGKGERPFLVVGDDEFTLRESLFNRKSLQDCLGLRNAEVRDAGDAEADSRKV